MMIQAISATGSQDFFFNIFPIAFYVFDLKGLDPMELGIFIWIKLNLHFTMKIHAKYYFYSIAGSLEYCFFLSVAVYVNRWTPNAQTL